MKGNPPIIVTGMHRSGTTLSVKLLTRLGAFFGSRLDPNAEDFFFMRLNEWVLRRAGGAWDYPLPALRYLGFTRFFEDTRRFLQERIDAPAFAAFSGKKKYLHDPAAGVWGFKDPRTVFTLPLWREIFPGARLLYIRRNGVDAANSLYVREAARWRDDEGGGAEAPASGGGRHGARVTGRGTARGTARAAERSTRYLEIRPLMGRFRDALKSTESFEQYLLSTRCLTLEEAFRLWEEYVAEGERQFAAYDGPKLDLRYESLIEQPEEQLLRVARFCGLEPDAARVREVVAHIDRSRACAFVNDPAARAFYESVRARPLMQALGYGDLLAAVPPR